MATDDDILAYENELQGIDEWESMHAYEMEMITSNDEISHTNSEAPDLYEKHSTSRVYDSSHSRSNVQNRLDDVLQRCAKLLGEESSMDHSPPRRGDREKNVNPPKRSLLLGQHVASSSAIEDEIEQYLFRQPPISTDSISIVLPAGERRFLKKKSLAERSSATTKLDVVLPKSVSEMLQSIEEVCKSIFPYSVEY